SWDTNPSQGKRSEIRKRNGRANCCISATSARQRKAGLRHLQKNGEEHSARRERRSAIPTRGFGGVSRLGKAGHAEQESCGSWRYHYYAVCGKHRPTPCRVHEVNGD